MIELALLGLLTEQELHGYELKKQFGELLGSWSAVSFGSLYPALARLERAGFVKAVEAHVAPAEPTVPMTGALSGELAAFRNRLAPKTLARGRRGKKVYGITEAGRARFTELLGAPTADDDRSFSLRVAFCRHLPAAERVALFERRKSELTTQLSARRRSAVRRSDPYFRLLRERDNRALTHDLVWIDELIAETQMPTDEPVPTTASSATHPLPAAQAPTHPLPAAQAPTHPLPAAQAPLDRPGDPPSPSLSELGATARAARS